MIFVPLHAISRKIKSVNSTFPNAQVPRFTYVNSDYWAETLDLSRRKWRGKLFSIADNLTEIEYRQQAESHVDDFLDIAIELEESVHRSLFMLRRAWFDMCSMEAQSNFELSTLLTAASLRSFVDRKFRLRLPLYLNLDGRVPRDIRSPAKSVINTIELLQEFHQTVEKIIEAATWLFIESGFAKNKAILVYIWNKKIRRQSYLPRYCDALRRVVKYIPVQTVVSYLLNPADKTDDRILQLSIPFGRSRSHLRVIKDHLRRVISGAPFVHSKSDFMKRIVRDGSFLTHKQMRPFVENMISSPGITNRSLEESSFPNIRAPILTTMRRVDSFSKSRGLELGNLGNPEERKKFFDSVDNDTRLVLTSKASIEVHQLDRDHPRVIYDTHLSPSECLALRNFVDLTGLKMFLYNGKKDDIFISNFEDVVRKRLNEIRIKVGPQFKRVPSTTADAHHPA